MTAQTPLKRVACVIAGQSPSSDDVADFVGEGRPFLQGNAEFGVVHPTPKNRCDGGLRLAAKGDVLVSIRAPVGALNIADQEYGIGRGLAAIRPGPALHRRFCWWWMHSAVDLLKAEGTGSTYDAVTAAEIGALRVPEVGPAQQRAIADFLDTETARIDALITKKRRMIGLVEEKRQSAAEVVVHTKSHAPLRRIANLLPGYMFASDDFAPDADGPLLLRGLNVSIGSVRWSEAVRLYARSAIPDRYRLVEGDVVVGMDRPFIAGGTRVARIDKASEGALLVQRVCRVRACAPSAAILIEHVLRSQRFVAHVEPDLTGVSVPHLSDEQIGSMLMPVFDQSDLPAIAARLVAVGAWAATLTRCLKQQLSLLQEHRQALITAAVTSELGVPGAPA